MEDAMPTVLFGAASALVVGSLAGSLIFTCLERVNGALAVLGGF
jgi:hypothetical protein